MKFEAMALDIKKQHHTRDLSCEVGILSQSDGSANVYHGDTSVLAAVYGPTTVRINKELIDKATVDVLFKSKIGLPTCSDKYQQEFVRDSCESAIIASLHPRTAINIIIQEMHDSGSLLACSINAAFLALLDAGIPLQFTVAAISCAVDAEGDIVLDPMLRQETSAKAVFTFAFDSKSKNLITSKSTGVFTKDKYMECLVLCREAATQVFNFYRESITRKVSKTLNC